MTCTANSPHLNPIEITWALIIRTIHEGGRQFTSKVSLWNAVKAAGDSIPPSEISNRTKSVDNRLMKIMKYGDCHVQN